MKKFLFLGIAATAMFASCTNDVMVEMNPQNAIGFETFVNKSTRVTDVTTTNLKAFGVYGWRGTEQIFNAQAVTANNGVCTYSPLHRILIFCGCLQYTMFWRKNNQFVGMH